MLTNEQASLIAYAAFQTHYRLNVINDEKVAQDHWNRNPQARTMWLGMVHSILGNAAVMIMETEQGLAKKPISVAEAIKRSARPEDIAARLRADAKAQGSNAEPFGPAGEPKPFPAPPMRDRSTTEGMQDAMGLVSGLAIGRATEQPETTADDKPSEPTGDA